MFGNWLKTSLLMAAIVALFGTVGALLGGAQGMLVALVLGGAMNLWAYWFSDKMVLRMYNAQEVDESTAPGLVRMVRDLADRAGLPMPRVYLIDEDQPNAFATGRNPENAAVAATTGIMRILTERELRGVMAHELAHVKHRDILISTISATVAGAVSSLAQFGMLFGGGRDEDGRPANPVVSILVMLLAPMAAMLIQFAISRAREFEADRGGAEISGDPQALASALDKIHRYAQGIPMATAEANPATAQMMIMNPLSGGAIAGLFSTHPDTGERIARLHAMAHGVSAY
ncbi:MAG: zinc metalloprotease HtpX [Betaproteobacteria bacterium]|nr:zinc metalloprotease HtpX [Betaproteobacteria bacterium]